MTAISTLHVVLIKNCGSLNEVPDKEYQGDGGGLGKPSTYNIQVAVVWEPSSAHSIGMLQFPHLPIFPLPPLCPFSDIHPWQHWNCRSLEPSAVSTSCHNPQVLLQLQLQHYHCHCHYKCHLKRTLLPFAVLQVGLSFLLQAMYLIFSLRQPFIIMHISLFALLFFYPLRNKGQPWLGYEY